MNQLYRGMIISNIRKALEESEVAKNYNNQVLKGRAREIFVTELLQPFLNPSMGICTGIIIDSKGNHSNQIDIIIYDKNIIPPSMLTAGEGIIPCESALATIEVKSNINSKELSKSVDNAFSIKYLNPEYYEINNNSSKKNIEVTSSNLSKIKVPITGLCIPKNCFYYCEDANVEPPKFKDISSSNDYDVVLDFVCYIIDYCNYMAEQRGRMYFSQYLREQ